MSVSANLPKAGSRYALPARRYWSTVHSRRSPSSMSSTENRKRAKLENDTAYQQRKAAEAGGRFPGRRPVQATIGAGLTTSQIELERPPKPAQSSADFLISWDAWIRAANFGELLLCALTLIFIRNQTAKTNSPRPAPAMNFDSLLGVTARTPAPSPAFRKTHESFEQEKTRKTHESFDPEGLRRVREALKDISFRLPGLSFKAYTNQDAV
jgi:hypothetical protein